MDVCVCVLIDQNILMERLAGIGVLNTVQVLVKGCTSQISEIQVKSLGKQQPVDLRIFPVSGDDDFWTGQN